MSYPLSFTETLLSINYHIIITFIDLVLDYKLAVLLDPWDRCEIYVWVANKIEPDYVLDIYEWERIQLKTHLVSV